MRRPTENPLEWWQRALIDAATPRHEDEPHAGFYARRAVKNGPLIPVRIYLRQEIDADTGDLLADEHLEADELGRIRNPVPIWTHLRPILPGEYRALVEAHRTDPRMSATNVPINVGETPSRPRRN